MPETHKEITTTDETEFILTHDKLVHSICRRFNIKNIYRNTGLSYNDLYQVGVIGLILAKRRYKPEYGIAFSTYAVPTIYGEIVRHIQHNSKVHVSRNVEEVKIKIDKNNLADECDEVIAEKLSVPVSYVKKAKSLKVQISYLQDIINEDKGTATIEDQLSCNESAADIAERNLMLKEFLSTLDKTERKIWDEYRKNKTQREIGKVVGLSQVQVSRTLKRMFKNARLFGNKVEIYS